MTASAALKGLTPQDTARFFVMVYINDQRKSRGENRHKFKEEEVFLVWFSKTLENWKALVATSFEDNLYYEVSHSGAKKETYVDVYDKLDNVVFTDEVSP